jgi:hypothetical protein
MIYTVKDGFQYVTDKGNVSIYADLREESVSVAETSENAEKCPNPKASGGSR